MFIQSQASSLEPQATSVPIISTTNSGPSGPKCVHLVDGRSVDLARLSVGELEALQCEQEPKFARLIVEAPKGSAERNQTIRHAYETICGILGELENRRDPAESFAMGMDARYSELVLKLLAAHNKKCPGGLFELGFGSGILLETASQAGYEVGGLEVADSLLRQAKEKLPATDHGRLLLGDFRSLNLDEHLGRYAVVYWNDVFEHIPRDEIDEYLVRLRSLLKPGGKLVTITPNWHMRPSDVTKKFLPVRSEAVGFHLKEYTLREVRSKLLHAGFVRVQSPAFISLRRIYAPSWIDVTWIKAMLEPCLEKLPYSAAVQFCRRFGLNCTIATT